MHDFENVLENVGDSRHILNLRYGNGSDKMSIFVREFDTVNLTTHMSQSSY